MREICARFHVPGVDLFPWADQIAGTGTRRGPVYRMEVLEDGSVQLVGSFEGDSDEFRGAVASAEKTIDVAVAAERDRIYHARFEPRPVVRGMIATRRQTPIAMEMPMEMNPDGSVEGTFIAESSEFAAAIEMLPDEVETEILRMGEYEPASGGVFDRLTDRQRDVLEVAVEAGYYEDPRQATHEDLAADLGVAPGTVSEHLRRIERRVFDAADPRR
jgi:hypothetical protein